MPLFSVMVVPVITSIVRNLLLLLLSFFFYLLYLWSDSGRVWQEPGLGPDSASMSCAGSSHAQLSDV